MRSRFTYNSSLGVCLWFVSGLEAWMPWSCIDEIVIGLKSAEEFYPSPPLGVDSADTSQLPKENNFHGQFQYFQITQHGSNTVPLHLCTNRGGKIARIQNQNLKEKSGTFKKLFRNIVARLTIRSTFHVLYCVLHFIGRRDVLPGGCK